MLANFVQGYIEKYGVPKEVKKIAKYCIKRENGKVFRNETEDTIQTIIFYHIAKKTIIVEKDKKDNVKGVLMWYNCNYDDGWDFICNWEEDKPEGDTILLAFFFADNIKYIKRGIKKLLKQEPAVLTKKLTGYRLKHFNPEKVDFPNRLFDKFLKI